MKRKLTGVLFVLGFHTSVLCGPLKQPTSPMQITADERSSVALKNTSQKAITQYRLACFKMAAGKYAVDWRFEAASGVIATGESTYFSVSNKSPTDVCRTRKGHLGVESVIFQDGTTWSSRR
jgi:hypothetical protein